MSLPAPGQAYRGGFIVPLPEAKWKRCSWCLGAGNVKRERTMHTREEIITCPVIGCDAGTIKQEVITTQERSRRRAF